MRRKILVVFLVVFIEFLSLNLFNLHAILGMSTPIVTLSNYSPNATNVDYTITFTTSPDKKLSANDIIDITFLHAYNFPSFAFSPDMLTVNDYQVSVNSASLYFSSPDPDDYWIHIKIPNQINNANSIKITVKGLTNPPAQPSWSSSNPLDNNPAINQWKLKVTTMRDTSTLEEAWSQPYTIAPPSVSNVKAVVSPDTVGDIASYTVSFRTSITGALSGGSSTITVLFPNNTILPSAIPSNSITVKVGTNQATVNQQITPSGQMVTFYLPSSINIGNNTDVQVIFSTACSIKNPLQSGTQYFVQVQTSSDTTLVSSDYYLISSSRVSNVNVSLTNNTVNFPSGYTISFKTSSSGVLTKNSSYINIVFPVGTYLPSYISKSYIDVDGVQLNDNGTVEGYTVRFKTPKDVGGLQKITVTISPSAGIKNPSVAKNDYSLSVFTTSDPGEALSNTYPIIESSITPATVNVEPKVVKLAASYLINFTLGSSGTLSQGDEIYITFPTGTLVPTSISQNYILINGVPSFKAPLVSQNTITIYTPQFLSVNSGVIIMITQQANIKNPSTPSQTYRLSISTEAEKTSVQSDLYAIFDSVKTSLVVNPSAPDGKNNYYISTPKVKIVVSSPASINYTVYYKLDSTSFAKYTPDLEIAIPEGTHSFFYYAEDIYGNKEGIKQAQFNVDLTKPQLVITSPGNNSKIKSNVVEIKGTTETNSKLTVNGSSVNINNDGSFSYLYSFSREGTEEIKVKSEDIAGNFTENTLTLTYTKQIRIMLQVGNEHCYVNDEDFVLKGTAPYIKNGRVMVPIRFVSEALGFRVEWDPIFKIVSVYVSEKGIRLQVGNKTADLFGKACALDSPPEIVNNTTFVPLRFISENFGASVTWDDKLQIVRIVYPKN